ncbi:hypothetical protein RN001_007961 [Aquatica leii]|uniref:Sulfakinin n=1 Tax=Aquatica leii TaxID=1421715 RepID=A0AAN7Q4R4_9COLE|nr:hypothetical protein RN001_007961 [Aquatica leii]
MFVVKGRSGILFILSALILFIIHDHNLNSATAAAIDGSHRQHRPIPRVSATIPLRFNKIRTETLSDLFDDDDLFDLSKRLVTDDYGHLRFGKRGEDFDDYGHLRFGRNGRDKELS